MINEIELIGVPTVLQYDNPEQAIFMLGVCWALDIECRMGEVEWDSFSVVVIPKNQIEALQLQQANDYSLQEYGSSVEIPGEIGN